MKITTELLDNLTVQAKNNERLRQNLDLRNSDKDNSQRMLNALEPGTVVPIHRHTDSSETVCILRGALKEYFYDEQGHVTDTITLRHGEGVPMLVIPQGVWHKLECLESGTVIFECKDGAYKPLQAEDIYKPEDL